MEENKISVPQEPTVMCEGMHADAENAKKTSRLPSTVPMLCVSAADLVPHHARFLLCTWR